MDFQRIPNASAMTSGADLWILADLVNSSWTQVIDWYVNFQFSKTKLHRVPAFSPELLEITETNGTDRYEIRVSDQAPLLIATENLLPTKQTSVVPYSGDLNSWAKRSAEIWCGLGCPAVRLFLPDRTSHELLEVHWMSDNPVVKTLVYEG